MNDAPLLVRPRPGLYLIDRYGGGEKPCDEAFKVLVMNIDKRCYDDPKKIPAHRGTDGDWYTLGTNHRIEGGRITRDLGPEEVWAVEVSDVMAFVDKHGGDWVIKRNDDGFCTLDRNGW